jgi:hypothetical protein
MIGNREVTILICSLMQITSHILKNPYLHYIICKIYLNSNLTQINKIKHLLFHINPCITSKYDLLFLPRARAAVLATLQPPICMLSLSSQVCLAGACMVPGARITISIRDQKPGGHRYLGVRRRHDILLYLVPRPRWDSRTSRGRRRSGC